MAVVMGLRETATFSRVVLQHFKISKLLVTYHKATLISNDSKVNLNTKLYATSFDKFLSGYVMYLKQNRQCKLISKSTNARNYFYNHQRLDNCWHFDIFLSLKASLLSFARFLIIFGKKELFQYFLEN